MPKEANSAVPGIIVCPEWWGLTAYPKQRAEELAAQGYAALAIDVYGDGKVTDQASQASEWMSDMLANQELLMQRAKAGLDLLATQPEVDSSRLGAIGFCFGGKIALDIPSPYAGRVMEIHVTEGDTVDEGALLVTLEST